MTKKFGFDIDGVLTAEGRGKNNIWKNYLEKFLGRPVQLKKNSYDFAQAYDISRETLELFLEAYLSDIYFNVLPAPDAKKVLKKLREYNCMIFLITARDEEYKSLTEKWLLKHSLPYDRLIHDDDKACRATDCGLDLFVDDKTENIIELSRAGIDTLIYERHHNKDLSREFYLSRVKNWRKIEKIIDRTFLDLGRR